ncbi:MULTISPECIES: DUF4232 domain-containing protein [Kitasatospora]|uniref:DUF4232 domain-containing protein n=1 Tax=Kitasatospora setae (strain ATCC 33774 / DSM 43861 / JCM 3304 / KCC A-0304 / NBRC 14216 / KM-6054) TaxID=452652 RepID=E4N5G8_KITSK|nr:MULTISPECIES: DUF4232 domain-containing protein [Kitasatospora]BAJ26449.1 hypothetical protein KSE_06070 [Kitasatospora setae KM-6054]
MRTITRLTATAAVALLAGLTLTACDDDGAATGTAASSSAAASAPAAAPTTSATGAGKGGATGSASAQAAGSAKCTAKDVKLTVTGPNDRATQQSSALAELRAQNTSGKACTLTGFPGVRLADDQGKSAPLDAVRQKETAAGTVTLSPGKSAVAQLLYSNVNFEGSASGRLVCPVTGTKVAVILPDTTEQVQVPVSGGVDNGTLNVCTDFTVRPFEAVA